MSDLNEKRVRLVVTRGATKGTEFFLEEGVNAVGRWDADKGSFPEIDLEAHDPEAKISRRHALIEVRGSEVSVEDADSMNGTFVNRGERLTPGEKSPLKDGDELIVGKTFLQVVIN